VTLAELRAQFRREADDLEATYLFSDASVLAWLNEAEREACKRMDLIHESESATFCVIATTASDSYYDLHAKTLRVTHAAWTPTDGDEVILTIIDRVELDRIDPDWRDDENTTARYVMVEDKRLRLGWNPDSAGSLALECYRLPLADMALDASEPEIAAAHHAELVHWALHKAYRVPDTEVFNKAKSDEAKADFERYFGLKADADRFRASQSLPTFVKAW
jgi:hypothetical protein